MKNRKTLLKLILWGILLAGVLGVSAFQETIIIGYGVVLFRTVRTILLAACGAVTLYLLIDFAGNVVRSGKQKKALREKEKQEISRKTREAQQPAKLSVKGKLEEKTIRNLLEEKAQREWVRLSPEISVCLNQMGRMDEYQERLSGLLSMNGVDSLKDTEDMLDAVEQYTFRNIRKAINYMNVLDPDSPSDRDKARDQLTACTQENGQRLNQVQDFLLALAEFLNKQGEGSQEIDMLQMYKDTILNSIQ